MVHALLPVILVTVLGASTVTVGIIEGVGEAAASISKLFSGWLSDRLGKRKLLPAVGYGFQVPRAPCYHPRACCFLAATARFSEGQE